ncbi:hypothetical protein [Aminomonas paucivorans]|uniref:hypothetical protein n=1 Tax=Aminomonas paucivorans TaxID=81412 RepID=UPI0018DBFFB0|nr:hypothetical protein [Aminomonas paucivorans]
MLVDLVAGVQQSVAAAQQVNIQYAVASKILKTSADLQKDMLGQLLGSMGIGNNLNVEG